MTRLLQGVKSQRTTAEQVEDDGKAFGRAWAEDLAALSEMRKVASLQQYMERNRLDVGDLSKHGSRVSVEFLHWPENADPDDGPEPWEPRHLPSTVPVEELLRISKRDGVGYISSAFHGFLSGVNSVRDVVEDALRKEGHEWALPIIPDDIPF